MPELLPPTPAIKDFKPKAKPAAKKYIPVKRELKQARKSEPSVVEPRESRKRPAVEPLPEVKSAHESKRAKLNESIMPKGKAKTQVNKKAEVIMAEKEPVESLKKKEKAKEVATPMKKASETPKKAQETEKKQAKVVPKAAKKAAKQEKLPKEKKAEIAVPIIEPRRSESRKSHQASQQAIVAAVSLKAKTPKKQEVTPKKQEPLPKKREVKATEKAL